ncbi:MAG: homoserine dehydrogenase [Candidatus Poribacteria bacterium]|nr:MAG: homoserine dehydrogenase [Candidatus Poribacteria bacterium]
MSSRSVQVGIIGLGTVGTGVVKILQSRAKGIAHQLGAPIQIAGIAVRDPKKARAIEVPAGILTDDPMELVRRPEVEIVLEVMGGTEQARQYVLEALRHKKHVVTANKALIALHGQEVFDAAAANGVGVYLEASVAGGIPIIKALHEGLAANRIERIYGILNGTCNYILTQMSQQGASYQEALAEAQRLGYAEADPTFDVDGLDTAHKIAILSSLAYGAPISIDQIYVEGIRRIQLEDIRYAETLGYTLKLLAISELRGSALSVRVHPALIPSTSVLANVQGAFNAVAVVGDAVGPTLFYGQGAGQMPTASAVVADLLEAARTVLSGRPAEIPLCWDRRKAVAMPVLPMEETETRYYLRMQVEDRPGVLAEVATILGRYRISLAAVIQKEPTCAESVPVVMLTHRAQERNLQAALREIDALECTRQPTVCIRLEADV